MRWNLAFDTAALLVLNVASAGAATLRVGPSETYRMPCAAFGAAQDGDTVEIDAAGNYSGDVCAIVRSGLTIRGIGAGRARIDAAGQNALGKGIWVVQGNETTIENIAFSSASVPDANGAGIRQEGKNLTVRGCLFLDNQNGILAGDVPGSEILIEYSEFDHNGAGDGYSHNLYVNHVAKLTFRYNYSHRARVGHLLKTRAAENHILYNRLSGESDGTQSYEVDVPNGGKTYVIGNVIEQGATTQNPNLLAYLAEGVHALNPSDALFVVNNSFVNRLGRGAFVSVGAAASTPVVLTNNIFFGGGTPCTQSSAISSSNYSGAASCFVAEASFDFRLAAASDCVDAGTNAGQDAGFSLIASAHYVHPAAGEPRPVASAIDLGAYELVSSGGVGSGGGNSSGAAGQSDAGAPGRGGTGSSGRPGTGSPGAGTANAAGRAGFAGSGGAGTAGNPQNGGAAQRGGAANANAHGGSAVSGAATLAGTSGSEAAEGAASASGCGCRAGRGSKPALLGAIGLAIALLGASRGRRWRGRPGSDR